MAGCLRTATLAGAVLLLLFSFPAAHAVPAHATVEATAVQAQDAAFAGALAASRWTSDGPVAAPGLSLAARQATVTVDVSARALELDLLGPTGLTPVDERQEGPVTYTGLVLQSAEAVSATRLLALPAPGATGATAVPSSGATATLRLSPGPARDVTEPRLASVSAPDFTLPVARSVEAAFATLDGAPEGWVRLTGDVRLVVTGMRLAFSSDQGDATLDTARRDGPAAGPDEVPVRQVEWREAVIDLVGADLVVPASSAWYAQADVDAASVLFQEARGTLRFQGSEHRLDQQVLAVSGTPRLAVQAADRSHLAARLDGSVAALAIDGSAVALDATPSGAVALAAWAPVVLLVAVGLAHVLRGRRRFLAVDRALGGQRYAEALALAARFRFHPWHRQDAALAAALSLTELGRAREARDHLLARAGWAPARQATRDFLLARAAIRLGDRGEAVRRLASSLLADPGLVAQARADPVLAPVMDVARGGRPEAMAASEAYA